MTTRKGKRSLSPGAASNGGSKAKVSKTDASACGIIKRISLNNFMCHGVFEWEPNKNVNFVTGANGSGKSSILQGLVLGLLADSKHTKRYTKLQDFIQRGFDKAKIVVTLKNEGEDAYKPEVYGSCISFQRIIWSSGQSSVTILDQNETVIRKNREAREEGKRVLECFRINTDNPIAILQQEEAKELLKVESPGNLYTFFQKATLLKQCMEQYTAATEQLDMTKNTIKVKRNALQESKNEFLKKKSKFDEIIKFEAWKEDEKRLSQEYVVSLGDDKLKEIEEVEAEVIKKKEAEDKTKVKLHELNADNGRIQKLKCESEMRLETERQKYAAQENDLHTQKLAIDQLKEDEKKLAKEIKGLETVKKTVEQEIKIFEEQISSLNSANSAKNRKQREKERLKDLAEVDEKMAKINEDIQRLGIQRESIDKNTEENRKELDLVEYERRATATKLGNLDKELKDMMNFGHQQLATYDTLAPKIAEQIRQAEMQNKFKIRPIGPVGSFIKLTPDAAGNPNLARLIETEIGATIIRCYLCNDDSDRRVLWDIFSRVYGNKKKPNIFTSKFLNQKHKVQRVQGHKTVMDFLEIDGNPQEEVVVFNHLVDLRSIETVVVTKTQEEAKKLCTFINSVPRNLNYCITQDFNKFFPPSNNTSYRSYFIDPVHSQVLGSNMSLKIAEKKHEIEKNKTSLQLVEEKKRNMERKKDKFRREHEEILSKITEHQKSRTNLNIEKSKLRAEEDPAENCNTLAEKLDRKNKEMASILKQQEEKIDQKKKVVDKVKIASEEYNHLLKSVNVARNNSVPLESELSKLEGELARVKKTIQNHEKIHKRWMNEIAVLKSKISELKKEERGIRKKAKDIGAPVGLRPSGTTKQLSSKIQNIKRKFAEKSGIENGDTLQEELVQHKKRIDHETKRVEELENYNKQLNEMNSDRNNNFLYIRTTVTNMIQRRFAMISATFRKQIGTEVYIKLDHKRRELNFIFKNAEGDTMTTEIQSLSGGEKSYAQMCLISSLWEHMNPPFRALDEWDVYLDAINRKDISNLLMNFGLKKVESQFLFISPQGAGDIRPDVADTSRVAILEIQKS